MKTPAFPVLVASALGLLLAAPRVSAAAGDRPADPPSAADPAASVAPIELRGLIQTPDGPIFRIYDKQTDTASWLRLKEPGLDIVVSAYRTVGGADQATVSFHGTEYVLTMRHGRVAQSADRPAGAEGGAGRGPDPGSVETLYGVSLADLNATEIARLQQVMKQARTRMIQEKSPPKPPARETAAP